MIWPFVHRSRLDAAEALAERYRVALAQAIADKAAAEARADAMGARYDALLEKFTALRLAGAVEPSAPAPAPRPADPVARAILTKCTRPNGTVDRRLYEAMSAQARADAASGVGQTEILHAIQTGVNGAEFGVPA